MDDEEPQLSYEKRLRQFLKMLHGPEGLIAKLAIFRELVSQYRNRGDGLWEISPPLYYFARAMQTEVLLALARLLESKDRSWGNLEKFLNYSATNAWRIRWSKGPIPEAVAFKHKTALAAHSEVIAAIKGRRDKVLAHLDRRYFFEPEAVEVDFPISDDDLIALANEIIRILNEHERGLTPDRVTFHLGEFYHIAIDNMVRSLEDARNTMKSSADKSG